MLKVEDTVFFYCAKNETKILILKHCNRPEKKPSHENQRNMLITAPYTQLFEKLADLQRRYSGLSSQELTQIKAQNM